MLKSISECLKEVLGSDILTENGHIDLTVTFVDGQAGNNNEESKQDDKEDLGEKIIENVPIVRLRLA